MENVYALLIGINNYHPDSGVLSLSGCHNDIDSVKLFLENQIPEKKLYCKSLVDDTATYNNIIDHFGEKHLLKAGKDDFVLIHFSGHGSRGKSAPLFKRYYPDGLDENLVVYDSRLPGHHDIADKELAILIDRLSQKAGQVIVILDCCHSGSGTRGAHDITLGKSRQWEDRGDDRDVNSYLGGYFNDANAFLPTPKHILIAACHKREKAYELSNGHGNLTYNLMRVLNATHGKISYADLFTQCRINMQEINYNQNPQFESIGYFNPFNGFLGLGEDQKSASYRLHFDDDHWIITCGAINGLPTDISLSSNFEVLDGDKIIGKGITSLVGIDNSSVLLDFNPDTSKNFVVKLRSLPIPKMMIYLQCDPDGKSRMDVALASYKPLYYEFNNDISSSDFGLKVSKQKVELWRHSDRCMLRAIEGNDDAKVFTNIFSIIELLCNWEETLKLENQSSKLERNDLKMWLVELDKHGKLLRKTDKEEVIVDILFDDNKEIPVPFRLEAVNNSENELNCALYVLSERYGIHKIYNDEIPAKSTAILMDYNKDGERYSFNLNNKLEGLDIFKLIVSKKKINDYMLGQNGFKFGVTENFWLPKERARGNINIAAPLTRSCFGFDEDQIKDDNPNDWYSSSMYVKAIAIKSNISNNDLFITHSRIKVLGHNSGFRANVSMMNSSSKNVNSYAIFSKLLNEQEGEVLQLVSKSKGITPPDTLTLFDIENDDKLIDEPLKIELDIELVEGESLLSLSFDGEHILPIGDIEVMHNKKILVSISHIPESTENRRRSLGKALKLCFIKLALKKDTSSLRWVDYSHLKIKRREVGITAKVKSAKKILIVIHGIIGDTKVIAESVRKAIDDNKVDLVLSFDYENLNSSIEDSASELKQKLIEVGILDQKDKEIIILAHSMGGLVSRYLIEELGGNKIISHLIMVGTPNSGSEISKITDYRDWGIVLLGLAINSPWSFSAAASILTILKASKKLTPTLEQMGIGSSTVKKLAKSDNPKIQYSIIAGHLDKYLSNNKDAKSLLDKLFKLGGKLFYGTSPNDIAVGVDSIMSVPDEWNPTKVNVDSHHMSYFSIASNEIYELLDA